MGWQDSLGAGPAPWDDPRFQALFDAAVTAVPYPSAIEQIASSAGLSPADLPLGPGSTGRRVWFVAFNEASAHRKMLNLVGMTAQTVPAFAERLAELETDAPALPRVSVDAPAGADYKGFSPMATQERQIVKGMDTLLDVRFLALGVERAKAVCRIEARFGNDASLGTGFLIGPRRVLTNHHVVFDEENADAPAITVQLQFGKELDIEGRPVTPTIVTGKAGADLKGERADDWAVITLESDPPPGAVPLPIAGPGTAVRVDDRVLIIQHPKGLDKKIGIAHNVVRYVDTTVMQYWTDTDEGSSGAPVFNEKWEVVALHHASVSVGDLDTYGYRNQGRTIARIDARVKKAAG
jgi:S1-C subfamily serine protease